ncbi:hypothetical protein [Candidatus Phytoplasma oryzae]|nr:hypothetical protein PIE28_01800 [Candidatus Phytoplasma oryzae]
MENPFVEYLSSLSEDQAQQKHFQEALVYLENNGRLYPKEALKKQITTLKKRISCQYRRTNLNFHDFYYYTLIYQKNILSPLYIRGKKKAKEQFFLKKKLYLAMSAYDIYLNPVDVQRELTTLLN